MRLGHLALHSSRQARMSARSVIEHAYHQFAGFAWFDVFASRFSFVSRAR